MANFTYTTGLRNVGSYQVSGTPFVTGSNNLDDGKVHMVEFPYVSKSVTVINITVPSGFASVTFDVKCTKLYVSQKTSTPNLGYQVFAELTQIPAASMYNLTGSGITE